MTTLFRPYGLAKCSAADWAIAAEALCLLVVFRVCVGLMPMRRIRSALMPRRPRTVRKPRARREEDICDPGLPLPRMRPIHAKQVAGQVRWAVQAALRHSGADFVCLPQALAGYAMLRRRGVRGTMVYGVARAAEGKLRSHAWLVAGGRVVLGGEDAAEFTAIDHWS